MSKVGKLTSARGCAQGVSARPVALRLYVLYKRVADMVQNAMPTEVRSSLKVAALGALRGLLGN